MQQYYDPATGRYVSEDPIGIWVGLNLFLYVEINPINLVNPEGLDVWVYNYRTAGRGYGHGGLIMPNSNGAYTLYSMGAVNPKAPGYELCLCMEDVKVHTKKMTSLKMPGAEMVKIPTKHNDQIQKAIDDYMKEKHSYHPVFENCADFVNDALNAADDLDLPDKTKPNDYMDMLLNKYGHWPPPERNK